MQANLKALAVKSQTPMYMSLTQSNTATMFVYNRCEYAHLHVLTLGFLAKGSLLALRMKLH